MKEYSEFLGDLMKRSWSPSGSSGLRPAGLFIGKGGSALEIAVAYSVNQLNDGAIRKVWKARQGNRPAPLLLVILHSDKTSVCGPIGEVPPVDHNMTKGQVERLCRKLLEQPDRHSAINLLDQTLYSVKTTPPGIRNEGLLALHELEHGVPKRGDLEYAGKKAKAAVGFQGDDLLEALGFSIEPLDNLTSVLCSNDRKTALAVILHEGESIEEKEVRFNQLSPISYAFGKADSENLDWIIFTDANRIRLYSTSVDVGVGRRGRTDTFIECQPWLLPNDQLHYLWLLYSAEALTRNGSLYELLDGSERFAGDLAKRLRERIYEHVVPVLAQGISHERGITAPDTEDLALTYEMALTVLFRLLFIAYAEDRDLLPYQHNNAYRRRSLKQKAQEMADAVANNTPIAGGTTHWRETEHLWDAIAKGNTEWDVPAYGGTLFSDDAAISKPGTALAEIILPNDCFEAVLRSLLVIHTPEGIPGAIDFRSLGVREFGTIYEGLLESELARADMGLILKQRKGDSVYVPAKEHEEPVVQVGETYLHNRSGARKSSGSYYTKSFAVEHLLDGALEPALNDHFKRLDKLDDTDAGEAFFDFRVADIAMGSGHFLISAIDRMEKKMADYLSKRSLPIVLNELEKLRFTAKSRLEGIQESDPIEDSQLLRRLIARRCIYGVDLNPLAVQLARLAVWIHTFVPGLPLSFLDRTLIHGNALVGIGTIDEIKERFEKMSLPLFPVDAEKLLGKAKKPLQRLANSNDISLKDIEETRAAQKDIRLALQESEILCDLLTMEAIDNDSDIKTVLEEWEKLSDPIHMGHPRMEKAANIARESLQPLDAVHFPIVFAEVFLRKRSGFDVILGNPPWEKLKVDKDAFWARHFPGLRGKSQREQEAEKARLREERPDLLMLYEQEKAEMHQMRNILMSGLYPEMGKGDPDLYKAFSWRFWGLSNSDGGHIGVVLPRSALAAKGSTEFRKTMFSEAADMEVTMLTNRGGWVFDEAEHRYTIGLVCAEHGVAQGKSIHLRGPYTTLSDFKAGRSKNPESFTYKEVRQWNDTVSLPLLPTADSPEVFAQLRKAPRLDNNIYNIYRGGGGEHVLMRSYIPQPKNISWIWKTRNALRVSGPFIKEAPSICGHQTQVATMRGLVLNLFSTSFNASGFGRKIINVVHIPNSRCGTYRTEKHCHAIGRELRLEM